MCTIIPPIASACVLCVNCVHYERTVNLSIATHWWRDVGTVFRALCFLFPYPKSDRLEAPTFGRASKRRNDRFNRAHSHAFEESATIEGRPTTAAVANGFNSLMKRRNSRWIEHTIIDTEWSTHTNTHMDRLNGTATLRASRNDIDNRLTSTDGSRLFALPAAAWGRKLALARLFELRELSYVHTNTYIHGCIQSHIHNKACRTRHAIQH